jgi:pimeloyl-ACP methyl ester carboxylesterase
MAIAKVNGLSLGYELIGETGPTWVITPGGRFSKDKPGVRELASGIADAGNRVLIWDRPNCGESDVCFEGTEGESEMQADYLAALLEHLELAPAIVAGGSAGARISLLTVVRRPEVARGLAMWWITGGVHGYVVNAYHYCVESIKAAWVEGMDGVVKLPQWQEVIERNPSNRQRFLDQDRDEFLATFDRWTRVHLARDDEIVAGLTAEQASAVKVPSLVVRSHPLDWVHLTATSERVAAALPNATVADWPDDEARDLALEMYATSPSALFTRWPLLVPGLLRWAEDNAL